MAIHISPDGKPRPCDAQPGNCKFGTPGEHYDTVAEAYTAAVEKQLDKLQERATPAAPLADNPYPTPSAEAKNGILDLLDAADDEEAWEDLGLTIDDRDAAYDWVRDSNKIPANPQDAVAAIEELLDVEYDEDELDVSPEAISEARAWVADVKKTFATKS